MESEAYVYLRSSAPSMTSADHPADTRDTGAAMPSQNSLLSELDRSSVGHFSNFKVTIQGSSCSKSEIREDIHRLKTLQNECQQYRKSERLRVMKQNQKEGKLQARALKLATGVRSAKDGPFINEKLIDGSVHTACSSRALDYQSLWSEVFGKPS